MKVARSRPFLVAVALLALGLAFAAGYLVRDASHPGLTIYTGSGYVGADQASFQVGDTWYGFESSVAWTDRAGAEHANGWPACLPRLQSVENVRFGGAVIWHGTTGEALVLWVDCRT